MPARPLIEELPGNFSPGPLCARVCAERGAVLLQSALFTSPQARYSLVTARPFLTFRSWGTRCELLGRDRCIVQFGNPWLMLEDLIGRYEFLGHDLPFPAGGCFGFWGYDLKHFVEPKLEARAVRDLDLPEASLFFCGSLVVFDHLLSKTFVICTGLDADGTRTEERARVERAFWIEELERSQSSPARTLMARPRVPLPESLGPAGLPELSSNCSRQGYLRAVEQALEYIGRGDIYQVNLSQRFSVPAAVTPWEFYQRLTGVSPAPFAAFINGGDHALVSSSPELFLRLSGRHVITRPIKGTRPRSADSTRDAQLTCELQTSPKEIAELVMITDLLRNDLGRISQFGSVNVPELMRLERHPLVQHLVSTVEGRLRPEVSHLQALFTCFPGGSITGAPKFRAMEIIEALEPVARGAYTGALGYIGFNRESQLSIIIRSALFLDQTIHFQTGAGIVADSRPAAEYAETVAKAAGFFRALGELPGPAHSVEGPRRLRRGEAYSAWNH